MHIFLKIIFVLQVSCFFAPPLSVAAETTDVKIVTHAWTGQSIKKDGDFFTLVATDSVRVIRVNGMDSLVHKYHYPDKAMWIPNKYLAGMSEFKPLNVWHGDKQYQISAGDHEATYTFSPDGTLKIVGFEHYVTELGGEGYKEVTHFGRLHQIGRVIWARTDIATPKSFYYENQHMFWLKSDGTLCHPSYDSCENQ